MAGKVQAEKWDETKDGKLCVENMEKKLRNQGYHFTMYEFPAGSDFADHTHEVPKKDSIVSGRFQVGIYGETVVLEPGDMLEIPKKIVHNAKVVGSESVMFYDASKI